MLMWFIISALSIASFAYLAWYLKNVTGVNSSKKLPSFSAIRQQEIQEELDAGRLSSDEAKQLKADLKMEVDLVRGEGMSGGSHATLTNDFSIKLLFAFAVFTLLGAFALYQQLGFNNDVVFTEKANNGQITREDTINFLLYRANKHQRAQDWYWLGKEHLGQGDYVAAEMAFAKALEVPSENQQDTLTILVDYAQSLFFANGQKVSEKLEHIVAQILSIDPNQTSTLGLKGIIEFEDQNFKGAILAWQKAIKAGAGLSERSSLLGGIQKARQAGNITEKDIPSLISHKIKVKMVVEQLQKIPSNSVFLVYAKAASQPMPVAIKRILPNQINNVIELTNLDNLMPGMTLKELSKVDVIVKLANQHDQDLTKGKDVASLSNVTVNSGKLLKLPIKL